MFWPGINSDIRNTVKACKSRHALQPSYQQEPLLPNNLPTRPFESISADFFQVRGKSFLVIAYSQTGLWSYPEDLIQQLQESVGCFAVLLLLLHGSSSKWTEGGPPFNSANFRKFKDCWRQPYGVLATLHLDQRQWRSSLPSSSFCRQHPMEILNARGFNWNLLEFHNIPIPAGRSPTQVLYGRSLLHPGSPSVFL